MNKDSVRFVEIGSDKRLAAETAAKMVENEDIIDDIFAYISDENIESRVIYEDKEHMIVFLMLGYNISFLQIIKKL